MPINATPPPAISCFMPCDLAPGLSFPYPSSRFITPHIPRPAPSAMTSVWRTSTAELKKAIQHPPEPFYKISEVQAGGGIQVPVSPFIKESPSVPQTEQVSGVFNSFKEVSLTSTPVFGPARAFELIFHKCRIFHWMLG